jgi:mono/diheme cytochrome c family protein
MKKSLSSALALALVSATSSVAHAQNTRADLVAAGHDFALKICSNCHVVAIDQASPPLMKPAAPSFSEIAARPGTTESLLRDFLAKPHGETRRSSKMPAFMLADLQATQIIAYLLSLKPDKGPAEQR